MHTLQGTYFTNLEKILVTTGKVGIINLMTCLNQYFSLDWISIGLERFHCDSFLQYQHTDVAQLNIIFLLKLFIGIVWLYIEQLGIDVCRVAKIGFYSKLIGSKNDNIQVLPSEIQEFPSTSWSKSTSSSSKFTSSVLHWWRKTPWQY